MKQSKLSYDIIERYWTSKKSEKSIGPNCEPLGRLVEPDPLKCSTREAKRPVKSFKDHLVIYEHQCQMQPTNLGRLVQSHVLVHPSQIVIHYNE